MQKFYLVRHGETDWNVKLKKLQGHSDIPLNETGIRQAHELAKLMAGISFDHVIASDLTRALHTARLVTQNKFTIETDPRLREVKLGVGEGLTPEEVDQLLGPDFRVRWGSNIPETLDLKFPGGETRTEVIERIKSALTGHLERHHNKTLLIVSHGYAIRSLVYHLTSIPDNFFVPNCAVVPFEYDRNKGITYVGPDKPDLLLHPKVNGV